MANPATPKDIFCATNPDAVRIRTGDSDPVLRALSVRARASGFQVWRHPDDKISVKGPRQFDAFGKAAEDAGEAAQIIGREGNDVHQNAEMAAQYIDDVVQADGRRVTLEQALERAAQRQAVDPIEPEPDPIQVIGNLMNDPRQIPTILREVLQGRPSIGEPERHLTGQRYFAHGKNTMFGSKVTNLVADVEHRAFAANPIVAVHTALSKIGPAGEKIALLGQRRDDTVQLILAKAYQTLDEVVRDMAKVGQIAFPRRGLNPRSAHNRRMSDLQGEIIRRGYAEWNEKGRLRYTAQLGSGEMVEVDFTPFERNFEAWYAKLNDVDNQFYSAAEALGLPVKPKVIADPDVNPTGRYLPHRFDVVGLRDKRLTLQLINDTMAETGLGVDDAITLLENRGLGTTEERLIRRVMENSGRYVAEKGQQRRQLTYDEAKRIVQRYVNQGAERLSGNIEKNRLGVSGYITDVQKIYKATWMRNAYRLADTAHFGRGDHKIHRMIDFIGAQDHKGAAREMEFVRKVYGMMIGRDQIHLTGFQRDFYNVQAAKLSLAVLANSTQSLNSIVMTGLRPFLRGAWAAVQEGRGLATFAERSGAIPTDLFQGSGMFRIIGESLHDLRLQGIPGYATEGSLLLGEPASIRRSLSEGLIRGSGVGIFRLVEKYLNRTLAVKGGQAYFDDIVNALRKRGVRALTDDSKAARRLLDLDIEPQAVMDALQRGDHVLLDQMRAVAGLRVSNATQFKSDLLSLPLLANEHWFGKFFAQFKTFAIGQARWMTKELSVESFKRDPARWARAFAAVTTVYPAVGIGLTALRSRIMGPTLSAQELEDALRDPSVVNLIYAGVLGITMAGAYGIIADVGATALVGNDFALRSFFIPPAGSSLINGLHMGGLAFKAITDPDGDHLYTAVDVFGREFGGVGSAGTRYLRDNVFDLPPRRGERPVDIGRAVSQVARRGRRQLGL